MQSLAVELQLIVIAELRAIDIVRLQQTCKHLYNLIEEFGHDIWKDCLQRLCSECRLYWPTYKDLQEASEFKSAATSPARFYSAYMDAYRRSAELPSTRVVFNLPSAIAHEDICDLLLVPGGRFLVALWKGRFSIWDVGRCEAGNGQSPCLREAFHFEIKETALMGLLEVRVVTTWMIRVLARRATLDGHMTYQAFEICWSESGNRFTGAMSHSLTFLDTMASLTSYEFRDETVILYYEEPYHYDNHRTVIWDFAHDKCVSWGYYESDVLGVYSNDPQTHVFYATPEGVSGVLIPPLQPVPVDKRPNRPVIVLPSAASVNPWTSWAYKEPCSGDFIGLPLLIDSSRRPGSALRLLGKLEKILTMAVNGWTRMNSPSTGKPRKANWRQYSASISSTAVTSYAGNSNLLGKASG
ncbi:hypothetical protein NMY22_g9641 [Coprinellus aureogranulatus]|nr:hypothetical protein NMY22_g9641 [Coprinellus aureogranulatus]